MELSCREVALHEFMVGALSLLFVADQLRTVRQQRLRYPSTSVFLRRFTMGQFLSDIKEIRRRARMHIEKGPITENYKADRDKVISVLNEALATEIVCVLRYKRHYYMAKGINAEPVAQEFQQHAMEEQ